MVAYILYTTVVIIIQLFIIPLPLDWVLMIILPNLLVGGILGWFLLKKLSMVFLVSFGAYSYFLLFQLSDVLTRWLYDLSWQDLFTSIFSINLNSSTTVLWMSAMALFQFLIVWFTLLPFMHRLRIHRIASLRLDDFTRFLFLFLLLFYGMFIALLPSLTWYVFAPLLFLSVYQILLKLIFPWRATTWILIISIVIFPFIFFTVSPSIQASYHSHIWVYIPLLLSSDSIHKVVHLIHKNSAKLKA
jgi:hypothetical protein